MSPTLKAQLQIHTCVLLWGFTAIFGKLISLPAFALVWWRMLLVVGTLLLLPQVWRGLRALPRRMLAIYAGIGMVVGFHWLTFYGAIKLSNASVAATCMALGPVFLAVIEPMVTRRRFDPRELLLGLLVIPGVALVVGGVPLEMRGGIVLGTISAAAAATFGVLNKRHIESAEPLTVTCIELGAGTLMLTLLSPLLLPFMDSALVMPQLRDGILLLLLAFACTLLPFALSLMALRHLSAFSAQLAVNLEPVYAVILAIVLLNEQRELDGMFYLGMLVILAAVFIHPLVSRRSPAMPDPGTLASAESKGGPL